MKMTLTTEKWIEKYLVNFILWKFFSWIICSSSELHFGFQKFKMKTYVRQIHLFKVLFSLEEQLIMLM